MGLLCRRGRAGRPLRDLCSKTRAESSDSSKNSPTRVQTRIKCSNLFLNNAEWCSKVAGQSHRSPVTLFGCQPPLADTEAPLTAQTPLISHCNAAVESPPPPTTTAPNTPRSDAHTDHVTPPAASQPAFRPSRLDALLPACGRLLGCRATSTRAQEPAASTRWNQDAHA